MPQPANGEMEMELETEMEKQSDALAGQFKGEIRIRFALECVKRAIRSDRIRQERRARKQKQEQEPNAMAMEQEKCEHFAIPICLSSLLSPPSLCAFSQALPPLSPSRSDSSLELALLSRDCPTSSACAKIQLT